jgi:hypothetical protein
MIRPTANLKKQITPEWQQSFLTNAPEVEQIERKAEEEARVRTDRGNEGSRAIMLLGPTAPLDSDGKRDALLARRRLHHLLSCADIILHADGSIPET